MLEQFRSDETEIRVEPVASTDEQQSDGPRIGGFAWRAGRALFGGLLAFMAVDNLQNLDERIGYAEAKGAPLPDLSVPATSSSLLIGSLGIVFWRAPVAAASAVAAFFVATTPVMHDFWAMDDPEERQNELFHFLKNTALLGGALAFLGLGKRRED